MARLNRLWLIAASICVAQGGAAQVAWQNPLPIGNNLDAISFPDAKHGWCVGDAGSVVRTPDGGETWQVQESNTEQPLYAVAFKDGLYGWAAGSRVIIGTHDGGKVWTVQAGDLKTTFRSISFADQLNGLASGGNVVASTSDGGVTWTTSVLDSALDLRSSVRLGARIGWLAGINTLLRTIDGGKTWEDMSGAFRNVRLSKIIFANNGPGWLAGTRLLFFGLNSIHIEGLLWKTTDGGSVWKTIYTDSVWFSFFYPHDYFHDVVFSDTANGFFSSVVGSFVSSDGGLTWQPAKPGPGRSYAMPDPNTLYSAGSRGVIAKSTDRGSTWRQLSEGAIAGMNTIQFFDRLKGVAAGAGYYPSGSTLLRTGDGGRHWSPVTSTFEKSGLALTGMKFIDSLHGWVCASWSHSTPRFTYNSGLIFGTTDGGYTWMQEVDDTSYYRLFGIDFLDRLNGLAVGSGEILRTTNGGVTWLSQFHGFGGIPEFYAAFLLDSLTGWAGGLDRLYFTSDAGQSWIDRGGGVGLPYYSALSIQFTSPRVGLIAGYDWTTQGGFVLKTEDGGSSWPQVLSVPHGSLRGLNFLNEKKGWVVGDSGVLATTTNGGASWKVGALHHVGTNLQDVFFLDAGEGWVAGDAGTIVHVTLDSTVLGVHDQVPLAIRLFQNYPNPFNPSTRIRFKLPHAGFVSLKVYNILGVEISTLVSEQRTPGYYEVDWRPGTLATGVYYYRLVTSGFAQTRRMILLR